MLFGSEGVELSGSRLEIGDCFRKAESAQIPEIFAFDLIIFTSVYILKYQDIFNTYLMRKENIKFYFSCL